MTLTQQIKNCATATVGLGIIAGFAMALVLGESRRPSPTTVGASPTVPLQSQLAPADVSGPPYPMPTLEQRQRYRRLWDRFYRAIGHSESSGGKRLTGDKGRSNGYYHLGKRHVTDAFEDTGFTWTYKEVVEDKDKSEWAMLLYWWRHCGREAVTTGQFEILAATHQGGPKGFERMTPKRRTYIDAILRHMAMGDSQ